MWRSQATRQPRTQPGKEEERAASHSLASLHAQRTSFSLLPPHLDSLLISTLSRIDPRLLLDSPLLPLLEPRLLFDSPPLPILDPRLSYRLSPIVSILYPCHPIPFHVLFVVSIYRSFTDLYRSFTDLWSATFCHCWTTTIRYFYITNLTVNIAF